MSSDAGDELNAELTHEKLDRLIEAVERIEGRLEALEAILSDVPESPGGTD